MPTIRGRVSGRPGTLLFVDAMLEVGGRKTAARAAPADHLVLRTDDDLEVRVEGIAKATKSGRISLSGRYGELVDHPICAAFAHAAPGDHVMASIVGFAIVAGDVVTIEADTIEERPSDAAGKEGGLRVAPARVPAVVKASRITIDGAAPEERHDADPVEHAPTSPRALRVRRPLETSTRVYGAAAMTLLSGWLVGAPLLSLVPERAWLTPALGAGLAFALVAVNRFMRARWHASYVTQVGGPRVTTREATWGYQVDKYVVGGYVLVSSWCIIDSRSAVVAVMTALPSVLGFLHGALAAWNDRAFRRFAATVLGASRSDPASGRMALVEGRLVEPDRALRRRVEFEIRTEVYYHQPSYGGTQEVTDKVWRDREVTSSKRFLLELADGRRVRVDPRGARVAFARRAWVATDGPSRYEEILRRDHPVCVVGRFTNGDGGALEVAAGGEESLFVWAGTRAELARAQWRARAAIVTALAIAALPVLVAITVSRFSGSEPKRPADSTVPT